MWLDNDYINPDHVSAVRSLGKHGSRGCVIYLLSGGVIQSRRPTTQVVSMLGLGGSKS